MKLSLEEAYRKYCLGQPSPSLGFAWRSLGDPKDPVLPDEAPPPPAPQPEPGAGDGCE